MANGIKIRELDWKIQGVNVQELTLQNEVARITLLSYGATIQGFEINHPGFLKRDVVLGFSNASLYKQAFDDQYNTYFGAIVGPIAGRINAAQIPWKDTTWNFNPNEGKHLLHGGHENFSNVIWQIEKSQNDPFPSATFSLESTPGMNLPGKLRCRVSYTLHDFDLLIEIETEALEDTIANPTQHSYFDPNGHEGSILESEVWIQSKAFLELSADKIPTGRTIDLKSNAAKMKGGNENEKEVKEKDLKKAKAEKKEFHPLIPLYTTLDHAFLLNSQEEQVVLQAKDDFQLKFTTNQPVFQIYIGGEIPYSGKNQIRYHQHSGICLEQQAEPDAPHHKNFSDIYLSKGEKKINSLLINFQQP
jgi:aldose 1-epimerase